MTSRADPDGRSGSGHAARGQHQCACSPNVDPKGRRQEAIQTDVNDLTERRTREGPPQLPLRSLRLPATDRRAKGRPSQDRSDVPTVRRAIDMSPHNDPCTSQATVSPDQDQPETAIAAFSSSRPLIHSSIESIRRASKAHHRARVTEIICNREEQNHPRTDGVKGTWRYSRPFDAASSQYWGRRRYGPARPVFWMA